MDAYINQCYAYGQDLGKRNVSVEDAVQNAFEFCETFLPQTMEGKIGMTFVQVGWEHPDDGPLTGGDKGVIISRVLIASGHIAEVLSMLLSSADDKEDSQESSGPGPDETIH
jgi:hypothetical protein